MRKFLVIFFSLALFFGLTGLAIAKSNVAEGQRLQQQLLDGEIECADMSDSQFESMGENYMEQMMGTSHEQMDIIMSNMMGSTGADQWHTVMGKRLSQCDTTAQYPSSGQSFGPMMGMMGFSMMGGNSFGNNYVWGMPWYMGIWSIVALLVLILFVVLLFMAILALSKYLSR